MAKINNKLIYGLEDLPSLLDYLIGSKDKNGKTRNFSLQSIVNLINGVNGKNVIQYQFFNELTPDVDYTTPGAFFTNNNETDVNNFTSLIFNKKTLGNYDLTVLFEFLSGLNDLFLGIDNPSDPNNFFALKVTSISNQTDYFIFEVQPYNGMYIGELSNETIYSFYWETKEWISEIEDINIALNSKLDHGGYSGTGQDLKNEIDDIASDLANNYYTKPEVDGKISSVYRFKGNVPNYASLPSTGLTIGDVYNALDTDINWAWTGTVWDNLGGTQDISGKEDKINKQNSLVPDGTGIKYPTVDAVNAGDALKLDKGTYTGNAGNLKADIDAIYQPDTLISSVPPTRSVNTFTYPANQYQALINKTVRTNPAQFITTIGDATANYYRTDLIWFKDDNTLQKVIGVENLTAAERPTIPTGQVGVPVSYINVFGSIISDPIPIINEISIQDSLGAERFKVAENGFMRFKGASFNNAAKQIEIDPLVGGVIFVSNSGNDANAEPENRNKPFKTMNAAIAAYWNFPNIDYIEIIDTSTYNVTVATNNGTTRKFELRSQKTCTVNFTSTAGYGLSSQEYIVNMPNASVVYNPSTATSGTFQNTFVTIIAKSAEFGANYQAGNGNSAACSITTENLTIRTTTGIFAGTGGTRQINIKTNVLNFRGANALLTGAFMQTTLDFNSLTHDNTFKFNSNAFTSMVINHGSISGVSPYVNTTNVLYLYGVSTNINYKTGSVISSNVTIDRFNCTGNLIISGVVTAIVSNSLVSAVNFVGLQFIDATVTCKVLIGGARNSKYISIINSYIRLIGGGVFMSFDQVNGGVTFDTPTVEFFGSNYIIGDTDGFNMTSHNYSLGVANKPSIQLTKGVLNTNGKFDRTKLTLIEAPLNQYYDTVQRQLVLVDEKEEIINKVLDSTKTYVINGVITLLTGEYIEVPAGGLTIQGYGYDTSGIVKNVSGQSIFTSPAGNSGNITLSSMYFNAGLGSVFNNTDSNGSHAIELNDVNFISCSSLGLLTGYRQLTATTCGIYSCSDGITLEGNWSGVKMINSNVIGFGASGTLFKKGTALVFSNRFYIDLNMQIATGSKICDFADTNFTNNQSLQVVNCYTKVNGVVDPNTTVTTFPNILPTNSKSYFVNNIGIKNSFTTPYGISSTNMLTYADDAAAAAGGIIQVGDTYFESSTGYLKKRMT
jgi:hypothetical protein